MNDERYRATMLASLMQTCDVTKLAPVEDLPDGVPPDTTVYGGGRLFVNCHPHDNVWHVVVLAMVHPGAALEIVNTYMPDEPDLVDIQELLQLKNAMWVKAAE